MIDRIAATYITVIALSGILVIGLYGCYQDNSSSLYPKGPVPGSATCDTSNVSYTNTIAPLFLANCAFSGCHASAQPTGGYVLDNYNGVRSVVFSGRLIGAITHQVGYSAMPRDAPILSDCDIALVESWINQGAENN